MTDSNTYNDSKEITVDEIMAKIKEEAARKRQAFSESSVINCGLPGQDAHCSSQTSLSVNPALIRRLISAAEKQADAGSEVSPMEQFNSWVRPIARAVGKVVVILLKFITEKQRAFNSTIISVLRAITDSHVRLSKNTAAELDRIRAHFDAQLAELARKEAENRITILEQRRSLSILLEQTASILASQKPEQIDSFNNETSHLLDDLYAVFEKHFRGSRAEVKDRLQVYLPYMERLPVGDGAHLIDIDSRQGEWLELLQDHGYHGKGIELNCSMVNCCQELGLDVVNEDALAYLRSVDPGSITAITGFHLLERLPFENIVSLFDEALRVLCPNGLIIFEAPNPENVVVGSCNFYADARRKNPLPPETISFIAEQRGFTNVEIVRSNRVKEPAYTGHDDVDELLRRFNCEQNYAIIASKAE